MDTLDVAERYELVQHCFAKVTRGSRAVVQLQFSWGIFPTRVEAWQHTLKYEEGKFGEYLSRDKLRALRKAKKPIFGYSVEPVLVGMNHKGIWVLERYHSRHGVRPRHHRLIGFEIIMVDKKTAARIKNPGQR